MAIQFSSTLGGGLILIKAGLLWCATIAPRSTTRCRHEQSRYGLSSFGADCVLRLRARACIFFASVTKRIWRPNRESWRRGAWRVPTRVVALEFLKAPFGRALRSRSHSAVAILYGVVAGPVCTRRPALPAFHAPPPLEVVGQNRIAIMRPDAALLKTLDQASSPTASAINPTASQPREESRLLVLSDVVSEACPSALTRINAGIPGSCLTRPSSTGAA